MLLYLFASLDTHALDDGEDRCNGEAPAPADKSALDSADDAQRYEEANGGCCGKRHAARLCGGQDVKQGVDHAQESLDKRAERATMATGCDGECAAVRKIIIISVHGFSSCVKVLILENFFPISVGLLVLWHNNSTLLRTCQ